jgi:hypothetical protein
MFRQKYTGLRNEVTISNGNGGQIVLPMFTIFISPSDLVKLAEVPQFKATDDHKDIATNLKTPPTKDWQRPQNGDRIRKIGEYYGTSTEKRLMPNPILLGESEASTNTSNNQASIVVEQMTDNQGQAISDVWSITLSNDGIPPLWILDGQHRTYGLESNINTKNQKIPVVLLIKSPDYTMQFLAQIFTEVTTGASELEDIHKYWMLYSFGMPPFKKGLGSGIKNAYDKAMEAVLHMVTLGSLDSLHNKFFNNIKFNPYDTSILNTYNYTWTSKEWIEEITKNYYENTGLLNPNELAEQIIRFLRAAENKDAHSSGTSKLFGRNDNPGILQNKLMSQFLQNLDILGPKSQRDWETHLTSHSWDRSDWRLLWASGSQSSYWGAYSNRAAEHVFKRIMSNTPFTVTPDVALRGPAIFTMKAYTKNSRGKKSNRNMASQLSPSGSININGGAPPWTSGANRVFIEFTVSPDGIGSIHSLDYRDATGQTGRFKTRKGTSTELIDLSNFSSPIDIDLWTCCFNEASKRKETLTIQW